VSRRDDLLTTALARIVELEALCNRYPTAYAYERACDALNKHRERADKLEAENKLCRDRLNAINDLTVGWQEIEVGRLAAWSVIDKIYRLSLLPVEREASNG